MKRHVWRCITVHFGDDVIDAAIARPYRKGLYAVGEHFGTFLADKQHNAPDWPVWWVEAERTPEHDAIADRAGVTLTQQAQRPTSQAPEPGTLAP